MKIRYKLILGFLLVTSLSNAGAIFTLRSYQETNETFAKLFDASAREIESLNDVKQAGIHFVSAIGRQKSTETQADKYKKVLQTAAVGERLDWADIRSGSIRLLAKGDEIVELIERNNTAGDEFREKRSELDSSEAAFLKYVDEAIAKEEVEEHTQHKKNVEANIELATGQTLTVMVLTIMLAIAVGLYISFLISRRIQNLKNAVEKVGRGELEIAIETVEKDEIGDLSRALNRMVVDVKGSRSELAAAQLFTEKVLESMIDFVVVTDMEMRITQINRAALKLNGYEEHELIGKSSNILMADRPFTEKGVEVLRKIRFTPDVEKLNRNKDGSLTPILMSMSVFTDEDGSDLGIVCVGKDISERKRADAERLVRSEIIEGVATTASLQELLQLIHRSIGKVLYAENCFVALYDQETEMLDMQFWKDKHDPVPAPFKVGKGFTAYVCRTEKPILLTAAVIAQLLEDGEVEVQGTAPATWLGVPLRTSAGIIGVMALQHYEDQNAYDSRDFELLVSVGEQIALAIERKQNAEILRSSEEQHRLLFEKSPQPAFIFDLETLAFLAVNEAAVDHYGYSREELMSTITAKDLRSTPDSPDAIRRLAEVRAGKDILLDPTRHRKKDGTLINAEVTMHGVTFAGRAAEIVLVTDVTERKRAEAEANRLSEEIENQRQRLNNTIANVQGIVWESHTFSDPESAAKGLNFVSTYVETMIGYNVDEWLSKPGFWLDIVHADDRDRTARQAGEIYAKGTSGTLEFRWIAKDGREVWVESRVQAICGQDGQTGGMRGVTLDITERKRAADALQKSEERYRDLIENAIDVIYTHDLSGNYTSINKAAERITGYTSAEALQMNINDSIAPEHREKARQMIAEKLAGKESTAYEVETIAKDGRRIAMEVSTRIILEKGVPVGVQGIARDITAKKAAEKARQESEERYTTLFEYAPDGIVIVDSDGYYLNTNASMCRMIGYSRDEFIGMHSRDIVASEEVPYIKTALSTIKANSDYHREWKFRRKDGSVFPGEVIATEMPGGKIMGMIRDITERKHAEEKLNIFNEKLQQSNRELQDFAYVASHDLQEPLRKVQAFSDRLKTKYGDKLEGDGLDYLERMRSAANRMQLLIQDLLTFSRVSTKAQPFVPVNLDAVAREVLSDLEVNTAETGAKIELIDLPILDADPMQMRQLLQNLIGNALKFRPKDTAPQIIVRGKQVRSNGNGAGGQFEISVKDNGIGFDEKYIDKIFAVFQRLHGRAEYDGSGVGLSICRKIAERHGGSITATSKLGEGSTFTITLPEKHKNVENS